MGHMWDKSRTELGQNEDSGQKWDKSRDTDIGNQHPATIYNLWFRRADEFIELAVENCDLLMGS